MEPTPQENDMMRAKLWKLHVIVVNTLIDYFKDCKREGMPFRASYVDCAIAMLRLNGVVIDKQRAGSHTSGLSSKDPLGNLKKRLEEATGMAFVYSDAREEEEEGEAE
jgi:hypothetical protein